MADIENEVEKEIENDLRTNSKYQAFFEQYSKASIDNFIDSYKQKKARWLKYGELYLENERNRILKYNDIAERKLWEIQQVKLFDTQYLWRAEQITIPEIKTSYDFYYWEKVIENCPFLTPISEDEFNLYREYVLTEDADLSVFPYQFTSFDWQYYYKYKRAYQSDDDSDLNAPEWYLFYNNRRGGNPYMRLPDIRGEKEDFYRKLYHNGPEAQAIINQPKQEIDNRPFFAYHNDETLLNFVTRFEERKVIEYANVMHFSGDREDGEELDEALETLKYADERIEINSTYDGWRTSLINTAYLYVKKKIYIALEPAYRSYLRRLKLGIAFETHESEGSIKSTGRFIDIANEHILAGRKLNNEPADFNF